MDKELDVYLFENLIGHLIQDKQGRIFFHYADKWLDNLDAIALSHSLPLQKQRFNHKQCQGFFAGILPEQQKRELIARRLGISARNDFSMLEKLGGECAGAVTFVAAGESLATRNYHYRDVSGGELANILRILPQQPLLAGDTGIRLSLAGVQDKIAVRVSDGRMSVPLDNAPSTHILKPAIKDFAGLVFNEAFCLKLASAIGLSAAEAEVGRVEEIDYLLIRRYDRVLTDNGIQRLHQEDFCQALGVAPERKYQSEGGPSLKQCFGLVREVAMVPVLDLQKLLDAVIFNFFIGNHDAHGKNFSILLSPKEGRKFAKWDWHLAPVYDAVNTLYYPELSQQMAMKLGGEYYSDRINLTQFDRFATEAELSKPMVRRRVIELAEIMIAKLQEIHIDHPVARAVAQLIQARCERFAKQIP